MIDKVKIAAVVIILLTGILSIHSFSSKEVSFYPEKTKVVLRTAGNKLLLKNNDSTSLVLPVKEVSNYTFELSFEKEIAIDPEELVQVIDTEFKTAGLSKNYITELVDCQTKEVSYSYEILGPLRENEIPCLGRNLPENCYTIRVLLLDQNSPSLYGTLGNPFTLYFIVFLLVLLSISTLFKKRSQKNTLDISSTNGIKLGALFYDPNQLKIRVDGTYISLTAKESELLTIFAKHPNQIIKREHLLKQVWEDQGVVVGRSLDMFISKLRKKLGNDSRVRITNVHGVGYKLEIDN